MGNYDSIVQSAAEKLLEDERLRRNLTDDEANLLVNWAIHWLEDRLAQARDETAAHQIVQSEVTRVRPAMQKINDLLANDQVPALPAAARALGLSSKNMARRRPADRKAVIQTLVAQLTQAWRK